ncbi:Regulator of ribonuclease activity A (plasmid) [Burkholderia gladioli]
MMHAARKRGLAGVVMDAAVRDADDIEEMDFPVFSVGTNPNGPTKEVGGRIGHPISCGGVTIHPGDFITADRDGVMCVEREKVESLLGKAAGKVESEARRIAGIKEGKLAAPGSSSRSLPLASSRKGKSCEWKACHSRHGCGPGFPGRSPPGRLRAGLRRQNPQLDELVALARQHNPVAIIVRYGGVTPAMMDAAPALKVISKHGSGTDTIDKAAADARKIQVTAAVGANAAAVAEQSLALTLACAKSLVKLTNACMPAIGTRPRTRASS